MVSGTQATEAEDVMMFILKDMRIDIVYITDLFLSLLSSSHITESYLVLSEFYL